MQQCGFNQFAVGSNLLASVYQHYVAHNNVASRYLRSVSIAYHLHRFVIVDLIEYGKLLVGLIFEVERKARSQHNCNEYAYGLEENRRTVVQTEIFVARDKYREYAGNEQYDDERVAELVEKLPPQRFLSGRSEHVLAILSSAFCHLRRGETSVVMFGFHIVIDVVCVHNVQSYKLYAKTRYVRM